MRELLLIRLLILRETNDFIVLLFNFYLFTQFLYDDWMRIWQNGDARRLTFL